MPAENDYLLVKWWWGSPTERREMLQNPSYTHSVVGFDADNKSITMHVTSLITRRYIPKDDNSSYLPIIVREKHGIVLLGFTSSGLNEETTCDFPEDLILK